MSEFVAVKPILVVGGAVGDVVLTLPKLPASGEDIEAQPQERQIGGCAFNVARALRRLGVPVINGMPVGNGDWEQPSKPPCRSWICRCCYAMASWTTVGVWRWWSPTVNVLLLP